MLFVAVVVFCHYRPLVVGRFIAIAQDRGMMNGDYAFNMYTEYATQAVLQPWLAMNITSATPDYQYRLQAFYAIKLVRRNTRLHGYTLALVRGLSFNAARERCGTLIPTLPFIQTLVDESGTSFGWGYGAGTVHLCRLAADSNQLNL